MSLIPTSACSDIEVLRRFHQGLLATADAASIQLHVLNCARCEAMLELVTQEEIPAEEPCEPAESSDEEMAAAADRGKVCSKVPETRLTEHYLGVPDEQALAKVPETRLTGPYDAISPQNFASPAMSDWAAGRARPRWSVASVTVAPALICALRGFWRTYTFSASSGALPFWLSLAPNGTLTGTPPAAGPVSFTAIVTTATGDFSPVAVTLNVDPSPLPIVLSDPGFEQPFKGIGKLAYQYRPSGAPWTYVRGAGVAGNGSAFTSNNPNAPQGTQVAFLQQAGGNTAFLDQVTVGLVAALNDPGTSLIKDT